MATVVATIYLYHGMQSRSMTDDNGSSSSDGSNDSSEAPNSILGGQHVSKGGRREGSGSDSGDSG